MNFFNLTNSFISNLLTAGLLLSFFINTFRIYKPVYKPCKFLFFY